MHKISAIVPNYNHARYLPESMEAIFTQSHKPDEVIIVDDASTDNSLEVIETLQKGYPEIVLIRNEKNSGVHYSFNKAVKSAKYDLIALFAADDIVLPGFFEKGLALFNKDPNLAIAFGDNTLFYDEKPYKFISNMVFVSSEPKIYYPKEFIELTRKTNFYIASSACLYKKELVLRYEGYDPNLLSLTDYYLNARIALRHPVGYIAEVMSAFRLLRTSYGSTIRRNWRMRLQILDYLMNQVMEKEDEQFKEDMLRSGLLSFNGYFLLLYLALTPKYWNLFPFLLYKVIKRKTAKY